jgi:hypothetical protein
MACTQKRAKFGLGSGLAKNELRLLQWTPRVARLFLLFLGKIISSQQSLPRQKKSIANGELNVNYLEIWIQHFA